MLPPRPFLNDLYTTHRRRLSPFNGPSANVHFRLLAQTILLAVVVNIGEKDTADRLISASPAQQLPTVVHSFSPIIHTFI